MSNNKTPLDDIEEAINQKLEVTRQMEDGMGVAVTTRKLGRRYTTVRQNLYERWWVWFLDHKGWRVVFLGIALVIGVGLGYFRYNLPLLVVVSTPILYIGAHFGAKAITTYRRKEVHALEYERKTTPFSVSYDEINQKVESVNIEQKVTGYHTYNLFDEAISTNPKPGSVQIVGGNVARDYINNREGIFVEYVSEDGMFAAGNPFTGFGNYALMESYQDPKYYVSIKYRRLLEKLENIPKVDPDLVDRVKVLDAHLRKQIRNIDITANAIQLQLTKMGKNIRTIGKLDLDEQRFLVHLDEWKTPWFKRYAEYVKIPETVRLPPLVEQMNQASSTMNLAMSLQIANTKYFHKAGMKFYEADLKIKGGTIDQLLQTVSKDSENLGSPVSAAVTKENIRTQQDIVEETSGEEEDAEW